jgi:hypothetical protein
VTTNQQLAGQLRHQADDIMGQRKVLLVTAVALAESRTVTGARKVIAGWDGPPDVRDSALKLLDELTTATTEEVTASRSLGVA